MMIQRHGPWQLQEAKARLSELVRLVQAEGPQTITIRGEATAVVISSEEYARLTRPPKNLLDALRQSPIRPEDEHLFRRQPDDYGREVVFPD